MKFNNDSLKKAVKEWVNDQQNAESKYGHISTWDTSDVTDMSNLFNIRLGMHSVLTKILVLGMCPTSQI